MYGHELTLPIDLIFDIPKEEYNGGIFQTHNNRPISDRRQKAKAPLQNVPIDDLSDENLQADYYKRSNGHW